MLLFSKTFSFQHETFFVTSFYILSFFPNYETLRGPVFGALSKDASFFIAGRSTSLGSSVLGQLLFETSINTWTFFIYAKNTVELPMRFDVVTHDLDLIGDNSAVSNRETVHDVVFSEAASALLSAIAYARSCSSCSCNLRILSSSALFEASEANFICTVSRSGRTAI